MSEVETLAREMYQAYCRQMSFYGMQEQIKTFKEWVNEIYETEELSC